MNWPVILGTAAVAALYLGSVPVLLRIDSTRRAERRFLPLLTGDPWLFDRMTSVLSSDEQRESDVVELAHSVASFVARTSLNSDEKQAILAALQQPSLLGRRAYMQKLVEAVGQRPQAAVARR